MHTDDGKKTRVVYGIGIGPGDPGLITVTGMDILRSADTIIVPAGKKSTGSLAEKIIAEAGIDKTKCRTMEFPMSTEEDVLKAKWRQAAEEVKAIFDKNDSCAFVTLGDPSIYSTWIYLRRALRTTAPDVECRTVPGIQTMNAAAALLEVPLVEGRERLALIPLPDSFDELSRLLPMFDTLVLYKIGKRLSGLCVFLAENNLEDSAYFVQRAFLEGEVIARGLGQIPPDATGYLSTMIVRTKRVRKQQ